MKWVIYLSDFFVPMILFYIVAYGVMSKTNVYDDFTKGAEEGIKTIVKIVPTILGLMIAVSILRASGALTLFSELVRPYSNWLHIPFEVIPVFLIRLFSASAANSLVFDIFKEFGTDSLQGLIVSIMMSCTETVFYTMSVYYMVTKVTKTRYTLKGALLSTTAGSVVSIMISTMLYHGK